MAMVNSVRSHGSPSALTVMHPNLTRPTQPDGNQLRTIQEGGPERQTGVKEDILQSGAERRL